MAGVTLVTGATGSGKTSLLATAAQWCWERHRKVSRLYVGDLGGWSDKVGNLVRLGIVEVWKVRTRVGSGKSEGLVEETLRLASMGWWPAEIDAEAGEVLPSVKMLPPVENVHRMICVNGHVVQEAGTQAELQPQLCRTCKVSTSLASCKEIEKVTTIAEHFKNVGLVMYEGLTSWGDWGMTALADRRAKNELAGEKSSIGGFKSGDLALDGNNRADYGFMQGEAYRWLQNCAGIIGLVRPPIWTALEDLTKNGDKWGPSIPGSAATAVIPQWVGDYVGAQVVVADGKRYRRLCLAEYRGEDGKSHPYKVRVDGGLPQWLQDVDDPQAPKFEQFSLGRFFDLTDAAAADRYDKEREKYTDAPGNPGKVTWKRAGAPAAAPTAPVALSGAPGGKPAAGAALPSPVPATAPLGAPSSIPAAPPPPAVPATATAGVPVANAPAAMPAGVTPPKPQPAGAKLPPPKPPAAAPKATGK